MMLFNKLKLYTYEIKQPNMIEEIIKLSIELLALFNWIDL